MTGERIIVGGLLVALGVALAVRADQPIVENYVGRQIPTAMVARNLARGSGFLRPTLDTAPFPNRFLVEPPIYAQVVALVATRTGFGWERSGRLTSAFLTVLGAWAFWGLTRRREGSVVALVALGSFGLLPVVLRYGRAFQPDAFTVGFVLLGLRAWDEYAATDRTRWAVLGGSTLMIALATKVTVAWCLIPWFVLLGGPCGRGLRYSATPVVARRINSEPGQIDRLFDRGPGLRSTADPCHDWEPGSLPRPFAGRFGIAALMLTPALAWYLYAWGDVAPEASGGSRASLDNAAIWLRTLSPLGWLRFATWEAVGRNLVARAFTPVGFVLLVAGWGLAWRQGTIDPLWRAWAIGVGLAVLALGAKWHHGYYWLVAAPLAAVGIARALVGSCRAGRRWVARRRADSTQIFFQERLVGGLGSFLLGGSFVACSAWQTWSTWATPPEWRGIRESGARIARLVRPDERRLLVAPEAVLYYADRPGFRLELAPEAMVRASGEWGVPIPLAEAGRDPLALLDFHATHPPGEPADRFRPDDRGGSPDRFAKLDPRAGLVADVGLVARPGEPRAAWRAAIRRRPGSRILIDEPGLFVADPGEPPR